MTPRGVRNNNPGNLRLGQPWEGLAPTQPDPDFCTFVAPEWGIRALALVLIAYQDRHGLRTVRGMIDRWAPPVENDSDAYLHFVAGRMGVNPDAPIDIRDPATCFRMVRAIIAEECGGYAYPEPVLANGIGMAGVGTAVVDHTNTLKPHANTPAAAPNAGESSTPADALNETELARIAGTKE